MALRLSTSFETELAHRRDGITDADSGKRIAALRLVLLPGGRGSTAVYNDARAAHGSLSGTFSVDTGI